MRAPRAEGGYGWVVVGVSAVVNSLGWSIRSTFALFYVSLLGEFAWGRGQAALGYSLSWLCMLVFSPVAGWLYDRWGARRVVPVGGLVLGAALALTGQVTAAWQYYVAFGVLGAAGIACVMMPAFAIVSRWFAASRGAALGVVSAGSSASAIVFYPLNAWLIAALGWRTAFVVFGLIVALVVAVAALFYREPPAAAAPASVADEAGESTVGGALSDHRFWAVFAMWGLGVIGYQIVTTHQVAHAVDRGFTAAGVAWLFGLGAVATVAGNVVGGWLSDRWGRATVFGLGTVLGIVGIGALAWVGGPDDGWLLVIYTASGFGFGMRISLLAAIPADLFSGPRLGAILGLAHSGGGIGGFIGPFLGGWLFDATGSYQVAFAAAAVSIGASAVAAYIASAGQQASRRVTAEPG